MTASGPPLTKSEYAYLELRRRILDQELPPSTRLLLRPLSEDLGLSVMPVRDAIRRLESDGLVTSAAQAGATVTEISADAVLDTIGIRMWIEVLAIEDAAPHHDRRTLAHAEAMLAEADKVASGEAGLAYARANRRLHEALEAPAPRAVRNLIDEVWDRLWQARRRMSLFSLMPDCIATAQREHREILEALRHGDGRDAGGAMARHRDSTLATWREALSRLPAHDGSLGSVGRRADAGGGSAE